MTLDNRTVAHYLTDVIRGIKTKALQRWWERGDESSIKPQLRSRLRRRMLALDAAIGPQDMNVPGWHLHPLKGRRAGQWSVWVTGNLRLVFRFDGRDATDVTLEDYH